MTDRADSPYLIASPEPVTRPGSPRLPALLGLLRLPEPVALPLHLDDLTAVGDPVQQRRGPPLPLEHLRQSANARLLVISALDRS